MRDAPVSTTPAGELARRAGLQPGAASAHLRQLTDAGLIRVRVQGRHRYHEIVNPEVATILEAIAQIAPPAPVRSLDQERAAAGLSEARTCYAHLTDRRVHLAGAPPAATTSEFLERGWLTPAPGRGLGVADHFDDTIEEWLAT